MNQLTDGIESSDDQRLLKPQEAAWQGDELADAPVPQFGLLDVIEAFTAMRHEWRGQAKESRAVAELAYTAIQEVQTLEANLLAHIAANTSDDARQLAKLLAETEHQVTRAATAIVHSEAQRQQREAGLPERAKQRFESLSAISRWFARPLLTFVLEQAAATASPVENPTIAGLQLVVARLRRTLKEQQIERLDTLGLAFDASIMNAIGSVPSSQYPAGHVAEQLAPGYRWRGQLLRFADVRVSSEQ